MTARPTRGRKTDATRSLMNAAHQRARERNPQSRLDDLVQCAYAERPHRQAFSPDGIECAVEVKRTRRPSVLQPPGEQKSDRLVTSAAHTNVSAAAEGPSSHCTSSTATSRGLLARTRNTLSSAASRACASGSDASGSASKRATSKRPLLRRRQGWQHIGEHRERRWTTAESESRVSADAGIASMTWKPRARARSRPARRARSCRCR